MKERVKDKPWAGKMAQYRRLLAAQSWGPGTGSQHTGNKKSECDFLYL